MKVSKNIQFLRSRLYLLVGILAAAALILLILLNRSTIVVQYSPAGSQILLDNAPINSAGNGNTKIVTKPGDHILKIQADGYVDQIFNLKLSGGRSKKIEANLIEVPKPLLLESGVTKDLSIESITTGDEENSVFFLGNSGSAIYKVKFKSDKSAESVYKVTNPGLSGIDSVIWGPKKDAAMFKKGTSAYFFDFQKYNFTSQQEVKFGDDIGDIAWAPDDSKIAYYYAPASGEQSLIFADKSNSDIRRVANLKDFGIENPYMIWSPSSEWLLLIPRKNDVNSNKVYLFNAYTRTMKTITETGANLGVSFSPDSNKILFSVSSTDPGNPVRSLLSVMNTDGTNIKNLDLRAEIGKTVWIDNSTILAATFDPETKGESLFKFNVDAKQKIGFSVPLKQVYVKEVEISESGNLLYFMANSKLFVLGL